MRRLIGFAITMLVTALAVFVATAEADQLSGT